MSRPNGTREAWQPQTRQEQEAILRELHEILASPHFCNSKRYPALLKYIVENTLAGKSDLLKERTIGVEVFDRPPTFDTNSDTVVRYTAGEVRKRLLLYYSESERNSGIRISLPAGSYIPEFLHEHDDGAERGDHGVHHHPDGDALGHTADDAGEPDAFSAMAGGSPHPDSEAEGSAAAEQTSVVKKRFLALALVAVVAIAIVAGVRWKVGADQPQAAVDDFWRPVLRDQRTVLICTGGVVFQQNNFSGVITAGKDIPYPFVSMQIASAITQITSVLERTGGTTQLLSSPSTPLTELREHSVILLGGYNNQWAMRLLQSQRIQFTPEPVESIVDRTQPQVHWVRDKSQPYSSADDYALIARFRDATTDGWVVVLAGLGRNGTEAAAQFVSSPHYMQLLRDQAGKDFGNRSIEAVLKVSVVDGKTGAPSILAVYAW
jgi:hypothetical protein